MLQKDKKKKWCMKFVTCDFFSILYHLHDLINHYYYTYVSIAYIGKLLHFHLLIVTNEHWMFKIRYQNTSKDQFYAILVIKFGGHA